MSKPFKNPVHFILHWVFLPLLILANLAGASEVKFSQPSEADVKKYWYQEGAEISRYKLSQARYGEERQGEAVLIYVTEPFHPQKQVKADKSSPENIPVLKLNLTKNFLTGIYPYSILTSVFQPMSFNSGSVSPLKVTTSIQEWCGHVFMQFNYRKKLEVEWRSYFETEGDQKVLLEPALSEDALFTLIRINPAKLPQGKHKVIPLTSYLRLIHIPPKAENAELSLTWENDPSKKMVNYSIYYPALDRKTEIIFSTTFPFRIEAWKETYVDGFGNKAKKLTSTATRTHTLKTPYWEKNSNKDEFIRKKLGLD